MSTKVKSLWRIALIGTIATAGLSLTGGSSTAQPCQIVADPKALADELFKTWNDTLKGGTPAEVAALYAESSVLLATVSNQPRLTPAEKIDYFEHFQEQKPSGRISSVGRKVFLDCSTLIDAGVYTFNYGKPKPGSPVLTHARFSYTYHFANGKWLITSHHSSAMPEVEFICQVRTPGSPPPQACPIACSAPTPEWAWGDWLSTEGGGDTILCRCLRTPRKEPPNPPPGCSRIPKG